MKGRPMVSRTKMSSSTLRCSALIFRSKTCGVSGNAVWGYLSGNGLLSAVAGGYIAARTAAAQTGG